MEKPSYVTATKAVESCFHFLNPGMSVFPRYIVCTDNNNNNNNNNNNSNNNNNNSYLPSTYKILTSIITERVYKHLDENDLLSKEQKGCRRGSYGCKDQLLINKAIIEDAKKRKKNLSTAW